jgi:uncharacterized peroxidase-related enzyme
MSIISIHSPETAPEASRPFLEKSKERFGFSPNILGALAESPAALEGYISLATLFGGTSFTATERQIVLIAASAKNGCAYCVAAHSVMAAGEKVSEEVIAALRDGQPIADARLEALRRFVEILVEKRGWASDSEVQTFINAGFNRQQVVEVVLGITQKTLSNYINHLADTPLDEAFASRAWSAPQAAE